MPDTAPAKEPKESVSLLARWKDIVSVVRDTSLLVLAFLLLAFPTTFNNLLMRAGFVEGNLVGFKWSSKLVDSDQALKDARATITDLTAQNQKLTQALAQARKAVDTVQKKSIDSLQQENSRLTQATQAVESATQAVISSNATMVESAHLAGEEGVRWAVVFGGDVSLQAAQDEVGAKARRLGISNSAIYLRKGTYRAVAVAQSRDEAMGLLGKGRVHRRDAYLVNLQRWCPDAVQKTDYVLCDQDTAVIAKP